MAGVKRVLTVAQVDSGWCSSMCPADTLCELSPRESNVRAGVRICFLAWGLDPICCIVCCVLLLANGSFATADIWPGACQETPIYACRRTGSIELAGLGQCYIRLCTLLLLVCQTQTAGLSLAFLFLGCYMATRPRRASCPRCQLSADLLITYGGAVSTLQAAEMAKSLCLLCCTSLYSQHAAFSCCYTAASFSI